MTVVKVTDSLQQLARGNLAWSRCSTQYVERKENLANLPPDGSFIAAQSIERTIAEIGEPQKTASDLGVGAKGRFGGAAQIILAIMLPSWLEIRSTIVPHGVWQPGNRIDGTIMGPRLSPPCLFDLTQDFALDLEKTSLDGGGTAQSP